MNHRFSDETLAEYKLITVKYENAAGCGGAFITDVERLISIIEANPQGFSLAPRRPRGREIRVVKIGRFDYLLYHEVLATEAVTIAIQYARRKSSAWRKRTP